MFLCFHGAAAVMVMMVVYAFESVLFPILYKQWEAVLAVYRHNRQIIDTKLINVVNYRLHVVHFIWH